VNKRLQSVIRGFRDRCRITAAGLASALEPAVDRLYGHTGTSRRILYRHMGFISSFRCGSRPVCSSKTLS